VSYRYQLWMGRAHSVQVRDRLSFADCPGGGGLKETGMIRYSASSGGFWTKSALARICRSIRSSSCKIRIARWSGVWPRVVPISFLPIEGAHAFGAVTLVGEVGYQYSSGEDNEWVTGLLGALELSTSLELLAEVRSLGPRALSDGVKSQCGAAAGARRTPEAFGVRGDRISQRLRYNPVHRVSRYANTIRRQAMIGSP
jgi:hypothetical protein